MVDSPRLSVVAEVDGPRADTDAEDVLTHALQNFRRGMEGAAALRHSRFREIELSALPARSRVCEVVAVSAQNRYRCVLFRRRRLQDAGAMETECVVPGQWIAEEKPDWTGLEALLPIGLCGPFMWMGSVMLEDGTSLGAYKHAVTRRYFHLDASGATFGYRGQAGYCRVRHCNAVEHVFDPLWLLHHATNEDKSAVIIALDEASKRDHADWDAGRSLPPSRV